MSSLLDSHRDFHGVGRGASAAAVAMTLVLAVGCTSDAAPGTDGDDLASVGSADPAVVADSTLIDPAEYATNGDLTAEEPGFVQADANTATAAELTQAMETNGIDDAARWVDEVIGHRPYRTADPSGRQFDDLRAALADADLDEFTVEAIIASLAA